ncbi:MAG: hypothetical protein ACKVKR_10795 [Pseudomonadales bacterium]
MKEIAMTSAGFRGCPLRYKCGNWYSLYSNMKGLFDKVIAGEQAVLLSGKSISCIGAIMLKRAG